MALSFDSILSFSFQILGVSCIGFFVFNAVKLIFPDQELLAAQQRLGVEGSNRVFRHWSLKYIAPFYSAMVPRIQQMKIPMYRQTKRKQFIVAGLADQFDPDEFVGLKICASALAVVFAGLFFLEMEKEMGLHHVILIAVIGFYIPDYVVMETRKRRQKAIIRELPNVMDLLTLSVEAGMDFMAALSRVIQFSKPGPLVEEMSTVLKEIQLGTARADALRNLADRTELTQVSSFVSILIQADEMGASIGSVLRNQSDVLRRERFSKAEREGAKASQKILLPLVICILPSVFIVIIGPVICDLYYNNPFFKSFFQ
jgi:tight adherence protein C